MENDRTADALNEKKGLNHFKIINEFKLQLQLPCRAKILACMLMVLLIWVDFCLFFKVSSSNGSNMFKQPREVHVTVCVYEVEVLVVKQWV